MLVFADMKCACSLDSFFNREWFSLRSEQTIFNCFVNEGHTCTLLRPLTPGVMRSVSVCWHVTTAPLPPSRCVVVEDMPDMLGGGRFNENWLNFRKYPKDKAKTTSTMNSLGSPTRTDGSLHMQVSFSRQGSVLESLCHIWVELVTLLTSIR